MRESVISLSAESPSRVDVHRMFDRISGRYDLLNRILSLGMDVYWRNRAVAELDDEQHKTVVDLACGTGDVAIASVKANRHRKVIGVDMASQMLAVAKTKVEKQGLQDQIQLARGDGLRIPVADQSVDAATIAFGIRNMPDTTACLKELRRVLRPGGKSVILEFSLPKNKALRSIHLFYLRNLLPVIGKILSGDDYAYSYLNKTIETYPYGVKFCELMNSAGFVDVKARPLTMGIVTLYTGVRN